MSQSKSLYELVLQSSGNPADAPLNKEAKELLKQMITLILDKDIISWRLNVKSVDGQFLSSDTQEGANALHDLLANESYEDVSKKLTLSSEDWLRFAEKLDSVLEGKKENYVLLDKLLNHPIGGENILKSKDEQPDYKNPPNESVKRSEQINASEDQTDQAKTAKSGSFMSSADIPARGKKRRGPKVSKQRKRVTNYMKERLVKNRDIKLPEVETSEKYRQPSHFSSPSSTLTV